MKRITKNRAEHFEQRFCDAKTVLEMRDANHHHDTCVALVKLSRAIGAGESGLDKRDIKRLDAIVEDLAGIVRGLHNAMWDMDDYDITFVEHSVENVDEDEMTPSEAADDVQSEPADTDNASDENEASDAAERFKTTPTEVPAPLPKDDAPVTPVATAATDAADTETAAETDDASEATPETSKSSETDESNDESEATPEPSKPDDESDKSESEHDEPQWDGPEWDTPSEDDQKAYNDAMSAALGKDNISVDA